MGTKLGFSKSILKADCLKFCIVACYFAIYRAIVTHPDQWTIIKLRIEKSIHNHAPFIEVRIWSDSR